jgi:hypothetical protein
MLEVSINKCSHFTIKRDIFKKQATDNGQTLQVTNPDVDVDWIHWAQNRDRWQALVNTVMNLWVP